MKPKHTEELEHASVRQYCKAVRTPTIGANFGTPSTTGSVTRNCRA